MARVRAWLLLWLFLFLPVLNAAAQKPLRAEQRTSRYFESIRKQPLLLAAFLRQMPKGADLHNHLSGAVYAESYIEWAAKDGLCVDRKLMAIAPPPCDGDKVAASTALTDSALYQKLVQSFSVLGDSPLESGHDHFFNAFGKFGPASRSHTGEMLAEVVSRAADQNEIYLELMYSPANTAPVAAALHWDSSKSVEENVAALRSAVPQKVLDEAVASARKNLDDNEARLKSILGCDTSHARPACGVQVRYMFQGYRNATREQLFAGLLTGFSLAQADTRIAGINLVQPEDAYTSMRDFDLQMQLFDYFHHQFPSVRISLHAGELAPALVPPEGLQSHIRESVERAHAERIGHGADVMYERDALNLLREMARRQVLVEICLSSNDYILGMRGNQHPLPLYLRYGVPVALATDDEGVARSDLSREFQRAVESYGLKYGEVKRMARMSLQYSFAPGESLWSKFATLRPATACATDTPGSSRPSATCSQFLQKNERARLQWKLEAQFAAFEAGY